MNVAPTCNTFGEETAECMVAVRNAPELYHLWGIPLPSGESCDDELQNSKM